MSADAIKFVLVTVLAIGVVEVGRSAGWSDQTAMGVMLVAGVLLVLAFFLYDSLPAFRERSSRRGR